MAAPEPEENKRGSKRPSERPGGAGSLVGRLLSGRYLVESLLGEGGMGAVYLAEHTHMRKKLAVKVLHPEMSRMPEIVARFEREAMAAAHIDHPNVAGATDFGKLDDGSFFLVLEYVEGTSLRQAMGKRRMELGRSLHILWQIAAGLGRAHALKIVHRDLKPENVMLVAREEDPDFVKILDFGIAKVGDLSATPETPSAPPGGVALTRVGMVFGTPEYMAPEQAMGQAVDGRADLYSLGIMAFEMLTGARPFEHDNAATLLAMQITAPLPTMASRAPEAQIPPEVEAIIARLLEKDAARRFADAKELATTVTSAMCDLAARGRIETAFVDRAGASGAISLRSIPSARASAPSASGVSGASGAGGESAPLSGPSGSVANASPSSASRVEGHPQTSGSPIEPAASRALSIVRTYAGRLGKRGVLWVAGGCALVLALLLRLVLAAAGGAPAPDGHVRGTDLVVKPSAAAPDAHAMEQHLARADAALQKGDYSAVIAELAPLEQDHPKLATIHRDLEQAYVSTGDGRSAVHEAELWLQSDPHAAMETRLQQDLRAIAVGHEGAQRAHPDEADAAIALLESSMGTSGPDILYDIAYGGHHGPAQTSRIHASLARPEVRTQASPALLVTLDLRAAGGCEAKRTLLERAGEAGDARTLAVLRAYQSTSGCGFLGMGDCWSCLHREGALGRTIEEIEARVGKP